MQYKPHQTTTKKCESTRTRESKETITSKSPLIFTSLSLPSPDRRSTYTSLQREMHRHQSNIKTPYLLNRINERQKRFNNRFMAENLSRCEMQLSSAYRFRGTEFQEGRTVIGAGNRKKSHFLLKRNRRSKYWISKDVWASHVKRWFIKEERIAWRCAKEDKKTAALMDLQM